MMLIGFSEYNFFIIYLRIRIDIGVIMSILFDTTAVKQTTKNTWNIGSSLGPKVFVVIPAYNESEVIESTLRSVLSKGYHIVVVDDSSTDGTRELINHFPVSLICHPINLGQGASLQTGMEYGLKIGADIIVHFDADGQHDADEISSMIDPIVNGQVDVVLGSRFLRKDDLKEVPYTKQILLRGARLINGVFTGMWLSDAHNGFRALSRFAAEKIKLKENGFSHASEILFQIRSLRLRYLEKPTKIRYSAYSQTKGQASLNSVNILMDLILRRLFT